MRRVCLMISKALAWVEYCNSSEDTYYANLRRQNGREKPYSVRRLFFGSCLTEPNARSNTGHWVTKFGALGKLNK